MGFSSIWGFIINLILQVIGFFVWLLLLRRLIDYSIKEFLVNVTAVCLCIVGISILSPLIIHFKLNSGWLRFVLVTVSLSVSILLFSYWFAIDKEMRNQIYVIVNDKLKTIKRKL